MMTTQTLVAQSINLCSSMPRSNSLITKELEYRLHLRILPQPLPFAEKGPLGKITNIGW